MASFTDKITDQSRTQIVAKGMKLNELIKDDILRELKTKFSDRGDIVATTIHFRILENSKKPVEIKPSDGKQEIIIDIRDLDFIDLNHPSPEHYKNDLVVITSNRSRTLETFLK